MPDHVEIALVIDRALPIARRKGVRGSDLELRRRLARRLFRKLRAVAGAGGRGA